MPDPDELLLVGKRIDSVSRDPQDDAALHLHFDDGSTAKIIGEGYDGLWDAVFVVWPGAQS